MHYSVLFMLVFAGIYLMSTFVKRAVQGRIMGASHFMFLTANEMYSNAILNLKGRLVSQYEPYYEEKRSVRSLDSIDTRKIEPSGPGTSGIYTRGYNDLKTGRESSVTLPANRAD